MMRDNDRYTDVRSGCKRHEQKRDHAGNADSRERVDADEFARYDEVG